MSDGKKGRSAFPEDLRARVRKLRDQKKTYSQIAGELQVSKSWVGNVLQGHGIKLEEQAAVVQERVSA